jgi:hypothetical protein
MGELVRRRYGVFVPTLVAVFGYFGLHLSSLL